MQLKHIYYLSNKKKRRGQRKEESRRQFNLISPTAAVHTPVFLLLVFLFYGMVKKGTEEGVGKKSEG